MQRRPAPGSGATTWAGTIELAFTARPSPEGWDFPRGFLEHRRRAERALASAVATSYWLGVS